MMAELDYDALQRLADAATPGVWARSGSRSIESDVGDGSWQIIVDQMNDGVGAGVIETTDAEFIVASRSALPALLARVRELEAERDDLESRLADFLCEVTGGLLSKTGYDARTMIQYTDEYYERRAKEDHDEHCDKAEPLEAERDAALSTIAKVEALHQKREVEGVDGDCATESCEHEDSCPLKKFEVCGECWDRCDEADIYFSERGIAPVLWPCPTIRALGSVPSTGEGNE